MVDLLLGGAAVLLLVVVAVVLVRGEGLGRVRLAGLVGLIVLAAGTFAVAIYHHQATADVVPELPIASAVTASPITTSPATQGLGTGIIKVEIPMGAGDKLPQGAILLNPPRPGTNAYTGDLSLLCSTPGKADHDQNCTGGDRRVWSVEPLAKRAIIGPATGDPFADPAACDESNGVTYQSGYLEMAAGKGYCVRLTGDPARTYALRVPAFPADQPLPKSLTAEVATLG